MKTYDIYAKQNGKWQRKGIQGDPTLPEYDGTVIIEKANTIKAGTYRFKNVLSVIPYSEIDEESYVIGIYPLAFSSNGYNWEKIIFYMSLTEYYMEYSNEDESDTWLAYSSDRDNLNEGQWDEEGMQTITIPKDIIANATFYEWFNSNTEGVSV
jgi:hypothetical protein